MTILHGGDTSDLLLQFPNAPRPIIDLSTGINPWPYPLTVDVSSWQALPQKKLEQECRNAIAIYTGASADSITLTPGTQIAISLLPLLFPSTTVCVISPTYGEHEQSWRNHKHKADVVSACDLSTLESDIIVVTNPNNPDGHNFSSKELLTLWEKQRKRGGYLIVDEAFADVAPEVTLAAHAGAEGLIILRSFGKFFGLAGVRLGAVMAPPAIREKLAMALGPWAVSTAALHAGNTACRDTEWIDASRTRLAIAQSELDAMLNRHGLSTIGGTSLFRLAAFPDASRLHTHLARAGIHVRRFDYAPAWLRFGIPSNATASFRLEQALETFR